MAKKKFVYILGVPNFANYESSASLIRVPMDGREEVRYVCIGEDRVTRLKHTYTFPLRGIDYCLKHFGLESLDEVDYVATDYAREPRWHNSGPGYRKLEHDYLKLMLRFPRERIHVLDHHKAHVASCYYPSGYKESGVLIVDGMGSELMTQSAYHFKGNTLTWEEKAYDWGIGRLYSFVTASILPYGPEKGYGKVMGLSAYGREGGPQVLDFGVRDEDLETDYSGFFSRYPISRMTARDVPKCNDRQEVMKAPFPKIAFEVQEECERQLVRFANRIHEETGTKNLCISGGVGLNGRANYRILKETPIENVWIQPGCSDTGISFGLALWLYYQVLELHGKKKSRVSMRHAYTGSPYSNEAIAKTLDRYNVSSRPTTSREIAQLLAGGKIVALFDGGSEFGPRALGHRSILADPRDAAMKDRLNASVKLREPYRPYAPVVLREKVSEYFDIECESPFMLLVADVLEEKRSVIPSVTHVDGTARIQTVTKADNGFYYDVLKDFGDITGVHVLLNTSFNINREPIVETPVDALICAFGTAIDYLVMQGRLVDCAGYHDPELVRRLESDREAAMKDHFAGLTRKYLHRHDPEEMKQYIDEENKIADWHRDYRAKYELEKAMLRWRAEGTRVLVVGTRQHTKCLYMYVPEFPSVRVAGFVPYDDEMGEQGEFGGVYAEMALKKVPWSKVDEIFVSSHEYQRKILETLRRHPQAKKKPVVEIYDGAGDSLVYVLPARWPVMNPAEVARFGLSMESVATRTASNIDFDFEPKAIDIGERYGVSIVYHYCHPESAKGGGGSDFFVSSGVDPKRFEQQIATLGENFDFATCRQLVNPKVDLPEAVINLTFDDGMKDVVSHVAPILRRHKIVATVFVCSQPYTEQRVLATQKIQLLMSHLGVERFRAAFYAALEAKHKKVARESLEFAGGYEFYRYDTTDIRDFKLDLNYRLPYDVVWPLLDALFEQTFGADAERRAVKALYLSEDDLLRLVDEGMEVGLHGHDHKVLPRLGYEAQKKNVQQCRDYVSHLTGVKELTFAHPQGFSDNNTKRVLKELGIVAGFGLGRELITPRLIMERWDIPRYDVNDCFDKRTNTIVHEIFARLSTGD